MILLLLGIIWHCDSNSDMCDITLFLFTKEMIEKN